MASSPSGEVLFLPELHRDGVGMSRGECSGNSCPAGGQCQPCWQCMCIRQVQGLSDPPPSSAPWHGSAQPSHTVPVSLQML